jgi:hypothetical protein
VHGEGTRLARGALSPPPLRALLPFASVWPISYFLLAGVRRTQIPLANNIVLAPQSFDQLSPRPWVTWTTSSLAPGGTVKWHHAVGHDDAEAWP